MRGLDVRGLELSDPDEPISKSRGLEACGCVGWWLREATNNSNSRALFIKAL